MEINLNAELRAPKEKLSPDMLPAVVYGRGLNSQNLKVKRLDLEKAFSQAGESNLITLNLGDQQIKVLVKDIQRDVMKHSLTHVDLYQVNMKEKINTEIPLEFIGEAPAVKVLGGMLMKNIDALHIECLPGELVDHIDIDISSLADFDARLTIADIKLPSGIKLLHHNADDLVVSVEEPKAQAEPEIATPAAPAAAPAPETK